MLKIRGVFSYLMRAVKRLFLKTDDCGDLFYIGGSDTLPPPLTLEEEKELIAQFSAGSQEARAILIERNLRLVVYLAKSLKMLA